MLCVERPERGSHGIRMKAAASLREELRSNACIRRGDVGMLALVRVFERIAANGRCQWFLSHR